MFLYQKTFSLGKQAKRPDPIKAIREIAYDHPELKIFCDFLDACKYVQAKQELIKIMSSKKKFIETFGKWACHRRYFGSYIQALVRSFPELNLEMNDFKNNKANQLVWDNKVGVMRKHASREKKLSNFWELFESKRYEQAKFILLELAGGLEKFKKVFPRTAVESNVFGSYITALMESFPELNLVLNDFPKNKFNQLDWKSTGKVAMVREIASRSSPLKLFWDLLLNKNYGQAKSALLKECLTIPKFDKIFPPRTRDRKVFGSHFHALKESFPELNLEDHDFAHNDNYYKDLLRFLNGQKTDQKALVISINKTGRSSITFEGKEVIRLNFQTFKNKKALFYLYEKNDERKALIFEYKGSKELKDYQPNEMIGYLYVDEKDEIMLERKK